MTNQRFALDSEEYVVDTTNSNPKVHRYAVYDASEKSLREAVLIRRVSEFVDKLLVNNRPFEVLPSGERYRPSNPENFSLISMIYHAVTASHLNTRDVALSLKYKFDGTLHRPDLGWQDTTSISLFIKDVECLLRNLYGDFDDDDVIGSIKDAILVIVEEFLRFTRNDLWLEHKSAVSIDFVCGIGVPEGMGISSGDHRIANEGVAYLFNRVREFGEKPDTFSQYSAQFLKSLEEHPTIFNAMNESGTCRDERTRGGKTKNSKPLKTFLKVVK
jgi:hypothetical protein